MEGSETKGNLLPEVPSLYAFEKKCDFSQSRSRQTSFILNPGFPETVNRSRSVSSTNSPQLKPNVDDYTYNKLPNVVNSRNNPTSKAVLDDEGNEVISNVTKEEEQEQEEEGEDFYSDVSSVILEEDEDEEKENKEKDDDLNEEEKKIEENVVVETVENNLKDGEKNLKDEDHHEEFNLEKVIEEGAQKEKELFQQNENLSENDSRDQLEFEMMNYTSQNTLFSSKRLRYSEKYRNIQYLVYPDDYFRSVWDFILVLILAYTCIFMPFRIAFFSDQDSTSEWTIVDWSTDSVFYGDIIVNFFSAYYDHEEELVVLRKKIAWNYFTGWFLIDITGVFPFDQIIDVNRYGNLVRVSRLPRLYRLMKLTRLVRLLKLVKERNKIIGKLIDVLRIGAGFERLFVSFFSILVFCHLFACFWFMVADLNDSLDNWIFRFDFTDKGKFDCYVAAFYYIVQTVVTVGYGDINSGNTTERVFSCFLMFIGVFFYSFTIGSLSSLLSNMDSKSARLDTQLNTLTQLKSQYNLDDGLYTRLKSGIKFGLTRNNFDKIDFLNNLPLNLRVELSVIMHRKLVEGIDFFEKRPARFIAFIGPYLKMIRHGRDEYIYSEGEYADSMFFIKQGSVSHVLKDCHNFEYLKIEKGYYFGEVDLLFGDTRKATIMTNSDVEILVLQKKHFTRVFFHDFPEIGSEIFKNALKRKLRAAKVHKEAVEWCTREKIGMGSFHQRNSLSRKSKSNLFLPQISIAKPDFNSSMREGEVFTASYRPFQKDSLYIPRHTKEQSYQIDKHLGNRQTTLKKRKESWTENKHSNSSMFNLQRVISDDANDGFSVSNQSHENNKEESMSENKAKSAEHRNMKDRPKPKKESYYEKFTSMLAKPTIAKNYIPFHLGMQEHKKGKEFDESIGKVDELQRKITKMDKTMEEILSVFKEMGFGVS